VTTRFAHHQIDHRFLKRRGDTLNISGIDTGMTPPFHISFRYPLDIFNISLRSHLDIFFSLTSLLYLLSRASRGNGNQIVLRRQRVRHVKLQLLQVTLKCKACGRVGWVRPQIFLVLQISLNYSKTRKNASSASRLTSTSSSPHSSVSSRSPSLAFSETTLTLRLLCPSAPSTGSTASKAFKTPWCPHL
jgi:hypothetical protein